MQASLSGSHCVCIVLKKFSESFLGFDFTLFALLALFPIASNSASTGGQDNCPTLMKDDDQIRCIRQVLRFLYQMTSENMIETGNISFLRFFAKKLAKIILTNTKRVREI